MEQKLTKSAIVFLNKNYPSVKLKIPITLNGRLSRTLGRFMHTSNTSTKIEMSRQFVEHNSWEEVLTVLYHELIHYARFEMKVPYHDGDPGFEADCARFGATSSGATNKDLRMTRTADVKGGRFVVYGCPDCGIEISRSRRYNRNSRRVHTGCKTPIVELRVEIRNGRGEVV